MTSRTARSIFQLALVLALTAGSALAAPPALPTPSPVLYVQPGATGTGCTSWGASACELQTAIEIAVPGTQIWVAAGVYKPTVPTIPADPRSATFRLKSGVSLYGGFSGDETSLDQRNWGTNLTTLSGDLSGGELLESRVYRVVTASLLASRVVLDGFVISGAYNDWSGPSGEWGGGMFLHSSSATLRNIVFQQNYAAAGAGLFITSPGPDGVTELENVVFDRNTASINGGGLHTLDYAVAVLTNVTFSANTAQDVGGGIYNINASKLFIRNTVLWGNTAETGPQIFTSYDSQTDVVHSDIQGEVYPGPGNLNLDPQFIAPQAGNLRLSPTSPLIDAGANGALPADLARDLDGNPRVVDIPWVPDTWLGSPPVVDIGAHETQPVIYVDPSALGSPHDGTTWARAFLDLGSALALASPGRMVWVAQGVYNPLGPAGDRTVTFQLKNGVAVYGGFPPGGGLWDQRSPQVHPSVLSGDIGLLGDPADNAVHVVTGPSPNAQSALLDGFTVTAGRAEVPAPGTMYDLYGGGVLNLAGAQLALAQTAIAYNNAIHGGGIANFGEFWLDRSTISPNNIVQARGGGIFNQGRMVVSASTVSDNHGTGTIGGAGIYTYGWLEMVNTTVSANITNMDGGGILLSGGALSLHSCTIAGNYANADHNDWGRGGGIFIESPAADVIFMNTIVAGNFRGTTVPTDIPENCAGAFNPPAIPGSYNLSSDLTCGFFGSFNMQNTDPLLAPLADNGGPTWTHALLPLSPAIDFGFPYGWPQTDQRGAHRPLDGDGDGIAAIDIGAFEAPTRIYLPVIRR